MTLHLIEEVADRWRVVIALRPADRRLCELVCPKDATVTELERFITEVVSILRKRRATDVTQKIEKVP